MQEKLYFSIDCITHQFCEFRQIVCRKSSSPPLACIRHVREYATFCVWRLRTGVCHGKVPEGTDLPPRGGTPSAGTILPMRFYPLRSGRFSFALPVSCYRARNAMLSPPSPPPLGLVTLSLTYRTLRVHSLGTLHSVPGLAFRFMGSGLFSSERCGGPSLWSCNSLY